jgi:hypothetical protein
MDSNNLARIKDQIADRSITAYEAFMIGVELQKNNCNEIIKEILESFEEQIRIIEHNNIRMTKKRALEKEIIKFFRTAFRVSDSSFDIERGVFASNAIYEGEPDFSDTFGIHHFSVTEFTEHSCDIHIIIGDNTIADKILSSCVKRLIICIANDSGGDAIFAGYELFDSVSVENSSMLEEDKFDIIKENINIIESLEIDDYSSFITICNILPKVDREWRDKCLVLSALANDGGKTFAKMIIDK